MLEHNESTTLMLISSVFQIFMFSDYLASRVLYFFYPLKNMMSLKNKEFYIKEAKISCFTKFDILSF